MTQQSIAVIAGDGIGTEVVPAALDCLHAVASAHGLTFDLVGYPWGSEYFRAHGRMMPVDGLETLAAHDAVLLGAVGVPDIPDTETLWGLLIPIRRGFEQYINLRPVRTLAGVTGPLSTTEPIDFVIVRENNEGEYSEVGGRMYRGRENETAIQEAIFTRQGVARAARFAAELARGRRGLVTSATKSNGIVHTMPFWDEVVAETVADVGGVELEPVLVDALAAKMALKPWTFDVVVASNLFGDILSDLGSALTGSIGVAPSANLNPERRYPSLFEPVHGSAPDIAGKGVANPVGQIWSVVMMLDHLGHADAAHHLQASFEAVLAGGISTPDLGGTATTAEFTRAVLTEIDGRAEEFTATGSTVSAGSTTLS
ncbi:tartrate dehydrogenase [Phytoactinopolyspora halotolerans]|uniref:D-malate dehydrogenase (decarboxylating) n=1 Tax=Phytoactinopolyspora halotolerans TaxID=1981512 RepID=A0A6L9SFE2_9ACTN|nr:tartrate dehydrogenase [Phytoactinopolyspora halotolerans]NEE03829.1 tartrate dehydrogenase [Phytoactinopolyspora halotolerans]